MMYEGFDEIDRADSYMYRIVRFASDKRTVLSRLISEDELEVLKEASKVLSKVWNRCKRVSNGDVLYGEG